MIGIIILIVNLHLSVPCLFSILFNLPMVYPYVNLIPRIGYKYTFDIISFDYPKSFALLEMRVSVNSCLVFKRVF